MGNTSNVNEQMQPAENKMGTMPVGKLLITMSLPMIISMLIQALYNVVDSMYVSQINENALTAVSLVFPMQTLTISVASGIAVGVNALLSRFLGAKRFDKANEVARHGIFLSFAGTVIMAVIMLLIAPGFFSLQTKDAQIYAYGVTYMRICCGFCIGIFMQVINERLLTSTGRTFLTMCSQATGAVINIIMDPILIFGLGPFPEMGVAGAAVATVFGQCVAAILGTVLNLKFNKEIHISFKGFKPIGKLIKDIFRIGVPSMVLMSIGSVMTFGMNMILMQYLKNSTAAAVFGVYFKLNSLFFMPVFGLNNGMIPIVAYNYGARHRKRIMDTVKYSTIFAVVLMLIGIAGFWLIPDKLLGIFNASENMLAIGVPALRIISISFLFAGYCIVIGSVMQALGSAIYSMINSITRQLVLLLPAAFILAVIFKEQGGLPAIWFSYDIAEIGSLILTTIFFRKVYKEKIAPLPE